MSHWLEAKAGFLSQPKILGFSFFFADYSSFGCIFWNPGGCDVPTFGQYEKSNMATKVIKITQKLTLHHNSAANYDINIFNCRFSIFSGMENPVQ